MAKATAPRRGSHGESTRKKQDFAPLGPPASSRCRGRGRVRGLLPAAAVARSRPEIAGVARSRPGDSGRLQADGRCPPRRAAAHRAAPWRGGAARCSALRSTAPRRGVVATAHRAAPRSSFRIRLRVWGHVRGRQFPQEECSYPRKNVVFGASGLKIA